MGLEDQNSGGIFRGYFAPHQVSFQREGRAYRYMQLTDRSGLVLQTNFFREHCVFTQRTANISFVLNSDIRFPSGKMFVTFIAQINGATPAGLLAHWSYFVDGERDLEAANIAGVHILTAFVLPHLKCQLKDLSARQKIWESFVLDSAYVVALSTSIVVYRLFLSPLRNVPGPPAMRISKLVHVWENTDLTYPNCKMLHGLRMKYGDVIRTGKFWPDLRDF